MSRSLPLALLCALLGLAGIGCGSAASAGDADPATAVPTSAQMYVEGIVRPEGDQREDVLDAARKLLRTDDPERRLRELVKQGGDGKLDYGRDVEPWLGERVGIWATGVNEPNKSRYLALVAAKDTGKAQQAIDADIKRNGKRVTKRSFEGVDYQLDSEGVAAGIVGDFATIGTEAEFKSTIKALDGSSLAKDKRYTQATDELDDARLGHLYINAKPFIEAVLRSDATTREQAPQLRELFRLDKLDSIASALLADGDRIALDTVISASVADALSGLGALAGLQSTPLLSELPGDSWAATGAPAVGRSLQDLYQRFAGALGGAVVEQQLRQATGLNLEQDVFGWMGDLGLFVRGNSVADIDGGLVIQSTDEARSTSAFGKFVGLARTQGQDVRPLRVAGADAAFGLANSDLAKPIVLARGNGRVVLAYGERAAADGIKASSRLGDAELFKQAESALGDGYKPSLLLSMPTLVALIDGAGDAGSGFADAKPYLETLSVLASGTDNEDKRVRTRTAVGFK